MGPLSAAGTWRVAYGVIFAFIAAFFAVPALLPAMGARQSSHPSMSWFEFRDRGITTATGHSTAREATILVLLLPFLILCFAIAVVIISEVVS